MGRMQSLALTALVATSLVACLPSGHGAEQKPPSADAAQLFRRDNLVAWCIVPFDAKHRGPLERVAMLAQLGFKHYAYDWRAEHLPTFETEVVELGKRGIELTGVWFPSSLNADAQKILDVLKRHGVKTQLWVTGGGAPTANAQQQRMRVQAEAQRVRPIAAAAAQIGCSVGLYNHGGWFGEPENELAILDELKLPNVGLVYNLHHGHEHLDRFASMLEKIQPHLLCLNLNGMVRGGEQAGRKIVVLGQGELDLELLKTISRSGYRGPIGILGHTQHDAEARLSDNLDGLDWLVAQLRGEPAPTKPRPRTEPPAKAPTATKPPEAAKPSPQANTPAPAKVNHRASDPRLKVVLIDRSEHDAFLGVRCDSAGRLFVGGRETVFVYEPDRQGGYGPRQTLCTFPKDSIIIGLELRGDDVYVLANHALYVLEGARLKRQGIAARRLLWGLPLDLHVSFHCLAWGPAGDLYLNHGDPLLNYGDWSRPDHWGHWTLVAGPAGTRVPYTGAGSVLRVEPDGSHVRPVAGGLRGPVGLAFDATWNLFTNDNDHESRADRYAPARLLHVTPQIDFAWPRGWMQSKSPERSDLVEPVSSTLGRGVPCDLAYYDESFLPELRGQLLMCRWDRFSVNRYPLEPRGASYAAAELPLLAGENNARPSGLCIGRGGRIFVTSLYLPGNVTSPYCPSDLVMITRADDPPDHPFDPYELTTVPAEQLFADLASDSWERRRAAHQEILRRGGPTLQGAVERLSKATPDDRALVHLMWLAARAGGKAASEVLQRMQSHSRPEVRRQVALVAAEFPDLVGREPIAERLAGDASPAVRLAALSYFFQSSKPLPEEQVLAAAADSDPYLRQTATRLLSQRAEPGVLRELSKQSDPRLRLAAMLAAGVRLTVPRTDDVPPAEVPLHYPQSNPFFHREQFFWGAKEPEDLQRLGRIGSYTTAERWKRTPHSADQGALVELLLGGLTDAAPAVRSQAIYYLGLLRDPRCEPRVEQARIAALIDEVRGGPRQRIEQLWAIGPFEPAGTSGAKGAQALLIENGAVDLSARYDSGGRSLAWNTLTAADGQFDLPAGPRPGRVVYYALLQVQSGARQPAVWRFLEPGAPEAARLTLWLNGRPVAPDAWQTTGGGQRVAVIDVQPGTSDLVVRIDTTAPSTFAGELQTRQDVTLALPQQLDAAQLSQRLKEAAQSGDGAAASVAFAERNWTEEWRQGSAERGRKLFATLACSKCHAIRADQLGGGGPSLTDARLRFTVPHLVESVLLPSKLVAAPFRATTVATSDGRVLSGLVVGESADTIELLLADASRRTVASADIVERAASPLSPMPAGLVRTPEELRDLLAYLMSQQPLPP